MSQKRRVGRPRKYGHLIRFLDDEEVYSPGKIARLARDNNMLGVPDEDSQNAVVRIRHTLARFIANHRDHFPAKGDDLLQIRGQSPTPAWTGARWKAAFDA